MADLAVRKAGAADLPAVLVLYAQADFNDGRIVPLEEAEALLERFACYPDYVLYVAEQDGEVVGTFCLLILDNIAHWGTPSGLIEAVVTSEKHRRTGLGKAMLRAAFEVAEAKGCYKVALSSNVNAAAAHAFYEGLGFERYGYSFRVEPPFRRDVAQGAAA